MCWHEFFWLPQKSNCGFSYVSPCVCVSHSSVQKQQADPHDHPEPARAPGGRGRGVHRLHPPDAVHGRQRHAKDYAVRGDARVAPARWQVAERALPPLGLTHRAHQVRNSPSASSHLLGTPHSPIAALGLKNSEPSSSSVIPCGCLLCIIPTGVHSIGVKIFKTMCFFGCCFLLWCPPIQLSPWTDSLKSRKVFGCRESLIEVAQNRIRKPGIELLENLEKNCWKTWKKKKQ